MSTYKYSALDESGKKTSGFITAHSEREARQVVKSMNLTPLNVLSVNKRFSRKSKVPQKDLLFATRQISTLLDSGVPLDETLQSISKEVENKNLSSALQSIRDEILQGKRNDIALGGYPSTFNQTYCSLIGLSKPRFFFATASCSFVGWSPTHNETGSPGKEYDIKKVIVDTMTIMTNM